MCIRDRKITPQELLLKVPDYEAVVVRSRTKIDANVIEKASKLKLIACLLYTSRCV